MSETARRGPWRAAHRLAADLIAADAERCRRLQAETEELGVRPGLPLRVRAHHMACAVRWQELAARLDETALSARLKAEA